MLAWYPIQGVCQLSSRTRTRILHV